jgi:integrase
MKEAQKSQSLNRVGECLYRNGIGIYFALVKVGGKQIKRSLKTNDLALAKRRLSEFRTKAERMHGKETRDMRFEELAALWLESVKPALKPKSYDRRRVAIVGLTPFFKGTPARSLGFSQIDEWRKKRGANVSARSHNIELESLRLLLRYACDRGLLLDNPADKFKRRKQPKTIIELPTKEEFAQLVQHLRHAKRAVFTGAADMVEFLAYSGMRVGEAREVCFSDVNFALGSLLITGGELGTKNHQERVIPLFPNLKRLLTRIVEAHPDAKPHERIFKIDSPRGAMELACKRAGLRSYSVHSLRHFFATNAIESGIHFKVIAEWLGHSDGGILVARTYGHLRNQHSALMAERMTYDPMLQAENPPEVNEVAA